ncbi:unnamed protein product [Oikopleura dioica]|uniref:Uncharacterized protein n=1 Tax=Oikopleura dioica TaxID=34765 RepID=E4XU14_OIKDI|nr:unnamed protein product [Oikopleura dioica]
MKIQADKEEEKKKELEMEQEAYKRRVRERKERFDSGMSSRASSLVEINNVTTGVNEERRYQQYARPGDRDYNMEQLQLQAEISTDSESEEEGNSSSSDEPRLEGDSETSEGENPGVSARSKPKRRKLAALKSIPEKINERDTDSEEMDAKEKTLEKDLTSATDLVTKLLEEIDISQPGLEEETKSTTEDDDIMDLEDWCTPEGSTTTSAVERNEVPDNNNMGNKNEERFPSPAMTESGDLSEALLASRNVSQDTIVGINNDLENEDNMEERDQEAGQIDTRSEATQEYGDQVPQRAPVFQILSFKKPGEEKDESGEFKNKVKRTKREWDNLKKIGIKDKTLLLRKEEIARVWPKEIAEEIKQGMRAICQGEKSDMTDSELNKAKANLVLRLLERPAECTQIMAEECAADNNMDGFEIRLVIFIMLKNLGKLVKIS